MMKLSQAIRAVMAATLASGALGGVVGFVVGRLAPSFVQWLYAPLAGQAIPGFVPTEFGLGIGVVSGLFLGAGASVFLAAMIIVRDSVLARAKPEATRHPLDS